MNIEPLATAAAQSKSPSTVDELNAWIEAHFECRQGPFKAYAEHDGGIVAYKVFGYSGKTANEANLCACVHTMLSEALRATGPRPVLYWRRRIELDTQQGQDLAKGDYSCMRLTLRIAIPGHPDFPVATEAAWRNGVSGATNVLNAHPEGHPVREMS